MANCKVCQEEIHPLRVKMGYKTTCVKHSTLRDIQDSL